MRRSGYLRVWHKALSTGAPFCFMETLQRSLAALSTFRQKSSLYDCLFCFQMGVFHQQPLIIFNKSISFTVALCYPNSESLSLLLAGEVGHPHTTSGPTATIGFCLLPSHHISFYSFLCRGCPFSPNVIHTWFQHLPFFKVWFFPGQRLALNLPLCKLTSSSAIVLAGDLSDLSFLYFLSFSG